MATPTPIGVNWKDVWKAVWLDVWTQTPGGGTLPPATPVNAPVSAGSAAFIRRWKRKKRS